jgi:DNA end-binding protein Ku
MAPRANWKGFLRLSLVSCPIALYPASSLSEKVSFNRINRKTGNRLKQQNIDSETGEVVPREDAARGYEVAKGQYVIVEDEEFEAVEVESTRTIEIDQFVPRNEIDERYIDSPYYIAPDGQVGQDAFAVIRDTVAKMNMVALGRVVLTRREHVIALEPRGLGLLGLTLRYPYEVREEQTYFEDIPELKLPKDMLDLARCHCPTLRWRSCRQSPINATFSSVTDETASADLQKPSEHSTRQAALRTGRCMIFAARCALASASLALPRTSQRLC